MSNEHAARSPEGASKDAPKDPQGDPTLSIVADLEARIGRLKEFQAEHERADAKIAARTRVLDDRERALAANAAELNERSKKLESHERSTQSASEADAQLAALRREADALRAQAADKAGTLEKAERARHEAAQRIDALEREKGELARRAESGDQAELFLHRRRKRLGAYRSALQRYAKKLTQVKETLGKRAAECARVIEEREKLDARQEALAKLERDVRRRAKRRNGLVGFVCLTVGVCLLGVMSWLVAERVAPSVFVASATVGANSERAEIAADQLGEWTRYATALAKDPRLVDLAAERMKRRGMQEFARAANLGAYVDTNMDVDSPAPGEITLTLRGKGAQKMERALETYIAAMLSIANDARASAPGALSTVVRRRPEAGPPIDDTRLLYAGAMWGGSTLLLLVLGVTLAFKLSKESSSLDNEALYAGA